MDSVTQLALGAAVGEACLGRKVGGKAALVGAACATLPDLDSFIPYGSAVASFTYHRSFSHSLIVLTLLSPLVAWALMKILKPPAELVRPWFLLVFLALVTHPLLDVFTVYGTQLFWPLYVYPFSGSSVFIVDPLYTLILGLGVLIALTTSRRSHNRGWINWTGLALSSLYLCWGVAGRFHVEGSMREILADRGLAYERLLATPAPLNSILWRVVVMAEGGYYEAFYPILEGREDVEMSFHADDKSLLKGIETHWPVERLKWFTHGFYSVREENGEVLMADLRMGLEPSYIFTFKVAELGPRGIKPVEDEIRPNAWSWEQIEGVLDRAAASLR